MCQKRLELPHDVWQFMYCYIRIQKEANTLSWKPRRNPIRKEFVAIYSHRTFVASIMFCGGRISSLVASRHSLYSPCYGQRGLREKHSWLTLTARLSETGWGAGNEEKVQLLWYSCILVSSPSSFCLSTRKNLGTYIHMLAFRKCVWGHFLCVLSNILIASESHSCWSFLQ